MTLTAIFQKAEIENSSDLIQSFEKIMVENEARIFNTIYSFINNYEDALDLTQETFIYAFRNIEKFRYESSISTWLYAIAINVCKRSSKKKKKFLTIFTDSLDDPETSPNIKNYVSYEQPISEALEVNEEQTLIRQAISSLPKKYGIVIVLKYLQDLSYEEIAQIVNCSVGTVKSRLSRAKEKLKPKLEKVMEAKHVELQ